VYELLKLYAISVRDTQMTKLRNQMRNVCIGWDSCSFLALFWGSRLRLSDWSNLSGVVI